MKFETTVYLGDVLIPKSELKNLIINSKTVDRIINDVAERQIIQHEEV